MTTIKLQHPDGNTCELWGLYSAFVHKLYEMTRDGWEVTYDSRRQDDELDDDAQGHLRR